jgi:MtrB/PioB family decaheme-associated outer membrane protein
MKLRPSIVVIITGLAINLAAVFPAFTQEPVMMGMVEVEGRITDVEGSKAKFHEYSDTKSAGVFGTADLTYVAPGYFVWFQATDPGYDTQRYRLETGSFGKFKFWFDYNEIIHNITTDAKTFYQGAGSDRLTGTPNTDPATWTGDFDYYTKRQRIDTGIKFEMAQPFFFTVSYPYEKKEGIKPTGVSTGSSLDASLELPEPIDYRTNGLKIEGGYSQKPLFLSFSYFYGEFRNGADDLKYDVPAGWTPGPLSLPPDNTFHKLAFKGSVKLPLDSKFVVNIGDEKTESDTSSFSSFDGKVDTRNYDFMVTSNPLSFLEGKVYYKYYERDNHSTGQTLINAIWTPTNPLYYKTNTYGAELGFRLPAKLYLNTGYKYIETDRRVQTEIDPALILPYNGDNLFFAGLKWSGIDFLAARVGYEGLKRSTDYRTPESEGMLNRKFAYAAQNRDTFTATVDLFPMDSLNLGLELRYKKTNYNDTAFGFTDDTRAAFSFNADYALQKAAKFFGYFDYEKAVLHQRAIIGASPWISKQEEDTYGYGVRADVYAIPKKLTFILQYDYLRAHGNNDFTFYDSAIWGAIGVPSGLAVNIPDGDDYQKYSVGCTAVYNWSEALAVRVGYAYARYRYSDAQLNDYQYYAGSPAASSSGYLTGAYSNSSYNANIVFLALTYQFR